MNEYTALLNHNNKVAENLNDKNKQHLRESRWAKVRRFVQR